MRVHCRTTGPWHQIGQLLPQPLPQGFLTLPRTLSLTMYPATYGPPHLHTYHHVHLPVCLFLNGLVT